MPKAKIPVPPVAELQASYDRTKSIRLTAMEFQVSSQTMHTWLHGYGVQINPQGKHDGKRWCHNRLFTRGNIK